MEALGLLFLFGGLAVIVSLCVVSVGILMKRLDRKPQDAPKLEAIAEQLTELEERNEQRLAELEERLDFAERMLTQQRERDRIRAPREG